MHWLWKHKVHFLIWAVLLVYLLTANRIYVDFFLKNGKPFQEPVALPAETGEVHASIDAPRTAIVEGESLFVLSGWVFIPGDPESGRYKKTVVFHSVREDLVFQAETLMRSDLTDIYSQYQVNLDEAGFQILFSKDILKPGNYRIGILLEDKQGTIRAYRLVDKYIEREANLIRFIED